MEISNTDIAEKKNVALSSVVASLFLTAGKLVVGLLTGSLGIISEAAHSGLDLCAALITYFAVRVSDLPADGQHNYGHAKVENFSALIEALLLFITCFWIIKESVGRLLSHNSLIEVNVWSYVVLIVSIIIDYTRSRALSRVAKKTNSQALEADALHFSSDIFSSLVVLIGLIMYKFGIVYADSLAALVVAFIVISASWKLTKRTVDVLLDKAPEGLAEIIAKEALQVKGVVGVHKIRLRQSGGTVHGDLHIVVERNISFTGGHKVAFDVEAILSKYSNDIVVHFEPEENEEDNDTIIYIKQTIEKVLEELNSSIKEYHELHVKQGDHNLEAYIHLVFPREMSVEEANITCDEIKDRVGKEINNISVNVTIEPCDNSCNSCQTNCQEHLSSKEN